MHLPVPEVSARGQVGDDPVECPLPRLSGEEVALLGGLWNVWPRGVSRLVVPDHKLWQRSQFLQIRVIRGERVCAWVQIAPCDPPPDEERDRAVISQYLNPRTFLMWLRSLIVDEPADASGGDWDCDTPDRKIPGINERSVGAGCGAGSGEVRRGLVSERGMGSRGVEVLPPFGEGCQSAL